MIRRPAVRRTLIELTAVTVSAGLALLGTPPFDWSVTAVLVACAVLPLRHLWPPFAVLGALWGVAGGLGWPPALVALYALGRRSGRVAETLPWLVPVLVFAVVPVLATQDLAWNAIVLTVAFAVFWAGAPVVVGLLVGTRARLTQSLRELESAHETALAEQVAAARAEERARIGREIHDTVGHHVTLIAVGAAALAASSREEETRRGAEEMRRLAKRAVAEMRTALGLGAPPPDSAAPDRGAGTQPALHAEVAALVEGARAAGVQVELRHKGEPGELSSEVERTVHRVVQESLTNAARHAPGATVVVRLHWGPEVLEVRVRNARPPGRRQEAFARGGAGLTGLAERVVSVGGTLAAGPEPDGGFIVHARLPRRPDPGTRVTEADRTPADVSRSLPAGTSESCPSSGDGRR